MLLMTDSKMITSVRYFNKSYSQCL